MTIQLFVGLLRACPKFLDVIEEASGELLSLELPYVLNFRDPSYSAISGGFHPVEVRVSSQQKIEYITDFAYYGLPPYEELAKCLDFDFTHKAFQQDGREFPLALAADIFDVWQKNFVAYYEMDVYTIETTVEGE